MEQHNNTVLVTGGTSGFGLQFATRLIAAGNTVIITGRDLSKLEAAKKSLPTVHIFQSDVSDPAAVVQLHSRVTAQFPDLNILINNAGEMRKINLQDNNTSLEEITREIEINLMGPIRMVHQFLPHLKTKKQAAILNVTSGLALVPFPLSPVYGASKAGLHSYSQSLRVQLKNTGIRVFELLAPAAKTALNDKFSSEQGFNTSLLMDPGKLVDIALTAMKNNKFEIYPGVARMLRIMSRLAPGWLLRQTAKVGADRWQ